MMVILIFDQVVGAAVKVLSTTRSFQGFPPSLDATQSVHKLMYLGEAQASTCTSHES